MALIDFDQSSVEGCQNFYNDFSRGITQSGAAKIPLGLSPCLKAAPRSTGSLEAGGGSEGLDGQHEHTARD
jgi:hypothetical protein